MIKKLAIVAVCLALLVVAGLGYARWRLEAYLDQAVDEALLPVDIIVEPGTSFTRLLYRLEQKRLIDEPRLLVHYLRLTGQTGLQAGEYRFENGITRRQMLHKMASGETLTYQVTLLEGWTFAQALDHLQAQEALDSVLDRSDLPGTMDALGVDPKYPRPEGLFFPDTYNYSRGATDQSILKTAYRKMQLVLAEAWATRDEGLPLNSAYQALILASIVERETAVDDERELIAGVFVGRLRKGMRLQTDPTVIYAMGEQYQGRITRRDLSIDSPYNTYRVAGLPPTPIALPSQRSIEATVHPEKTDKVFFVARGDGSHHFSRTLEEHNRAVRQYQLNRVENYRSTPLPASR